MKSKKFDIEDKKDLNKLKNVQKIMIISTFKTG